MLKEKIIKSYDINAWYIISVVLMCLFAALYYQIAWQYPIVDGFPLAERLLNDQFNPVDFYTNTFSDYSPRYYISNLYVLGASLFNVHYTKFVAVANVVRIFITFIALYFLYLGLTRNKLIALIALYLSSLSYLSIPKMPAWWPLVFDMTGAGTAEMFLMIAWSLILFNRLLYAYIAIAIALLFHPVAGIYGFIIGVLLLYSRSGFNGIIKQMKKPATYVGGIIMAAGFLMNYIPYLNSLNGFKLDDEIFINIIVNFRHPHHYLPSHFGWQIWTSFSVFSMFFLYIWKQVKVSLYNEKIVIIIVVYALSLMLLGWLFTEVYPTRLAASLIPFRGIPILLPVYVMVVAVFMYERFKEADYVSFLLLHLPFLPYQSVGLTWYLFPGYHSLTLPTVILLIVFALVYVFQHKVVLIDKINSAISPAFRVDVFYKFTAFMSIIVLLFALVKFDFKIPSLTNSVQIYQWLYNNTSDNDLIIAELNAANNQKIRLISRRPVVISKDFPFLEKYYQEWYSRYSNIYKNQKKARGHIDSLSATDLNQLLDKYDAGILLRTKELDVNNYFELIGTAQGESAKVFIYRNISLMR